MPQTRGKGSRERRTQPRAWWLYLESQAEVDAFMDELRKELEASLSAGKRVQVR